MRCASSEATGFRVLRTLVGTRDCVRLQSCCCLARAYAVSNSNDVCHAEGVGRKTKDSGVDGLLVVDKPAGWTSHDVVAKCRGAYRQRRCGHAGTLDPGATGTLLVGFGHCTKLLPYLTALPKVYTTEIVLGATTSTLDDSGDVLQRFDMSAVTLDAVRVASAQFVGDIDQIPPMVSAVQIGGVRLHELARQGIEVERAARRVTVYRYDVISQVAPGVFSAEVECGSGTYVRSLVDDLGRVLGGGAHLRNLRRTRSGSFLAADGVSPDSEAFGTRALFSPNNAMRDYPQAVVGDTLAAQVANGVVFSAAVLSPPPDFATEGPYRVVSESGGLLALYRQVVDKACPVVVLPTR